MQVIVDELVRCGITDAVPAPRLAVRGARPRSPRRRRGRAVAAARADRRALGRLPRPGPGQGLASPGRRADDVGDGRRQPAPGRARGVGTPACRCSVARRRSHRSNTQPTKRGQEPSRIAHYTRAYLYHLFKAREILSATLCTIHNERFLVGGWTKSGPRSAQASSTNSARTSWVGTTRRVHNKTMTTAAVLDLSNRANTYPDYTRRSVSVDLCSW